MDILQEIVAHKQEELRLMRAKKPSLRDALLASPTGIIAEFKKRKKVGQISSPSPTRTLALLHSPSSRTSTTLVVTTASSSPLAPLVSPYPYSTRTSSSMNSNSMKPPFVALPLYSSSRPALQKPTAPLSFRRPTPSDSKCSWRCIQSKNWSTQNCNPTSAVLTTVISVPSRQR